MIPYHLIRHVNIEFLIISFYCIIWNYIYHFTSSFGIIFNIPLQLLTIVRVNVSWDVDSDICSRNRTCSGKQKKGLSWSCTNCEACLYDKEDASHVQCFLNNFSLARKHQGLCRKTVLRRVFKSCSDSFLLHLVCFFSKACYAVVVVGSTIKLWSSSGAMPILFESYYS